MEERCRRREREKRGGRVRRGRGRGEREVWCGEKIEEEWSKNAHEGWKKMDANTPIDA